MAGAGRSEGGHFEVFRQVAVLVLERSYGSGRVGIANVSFQGSEALFERGRRRGCGRSFRSAQRRA